MGGFGSAVIEALARRTAAVKMEGDYMKDGLLYCGKCNTKKQCEIVVEGQKIVVGCSCECSNRKYEEGIREQKRKEELLRIEQLRANGLTDKHIRNYRFENATETTQITKCRKYVEKWEQVLENNNGLLFFGGTGTGKTFAAGCIANALIDKGVPCLVTSFPKIINSGFDKSEVINSMKNYKLLVIDDLGTERSSEYSIETIYLTIDERYKSGLPLIVTTNLSLQEMASTTDIAYKRIYERILEMCVPVRFEGQSLRREKAKEKMNIAKEIFE